MSTNKQVKTHPGASIKEIIYAMATNLFSMPQAMSAKQNNKQRKNYEDTGIVRQ